MDHTFIHTDVPLSPEFPLLPVPSVHHRSRRAARVVFDLETAPLPDAVTYMEPVEAPTTYKDPEKIAAYVAQHTLDRLKKCALDVDLCQIVVIGLWHEETRRTIVLTTRHMTEADLLRAFWVQTQGCHLVGFNCLAFDLPVLLRRSLYLDVPANTLQIDRFRHPDITDLMQMLSYNGTVRLRSLSFYAKRLNSLIQDVLVGADIPQAVADGRWNDIETHVTADVLKTVFLATRLGVLSRPVQQGDDA